MDHIVAQKRGDKWMTYLLQRKEVVVHWSRPSAETKHCMVFPCDVSSRDCEIMIPKNFYSTVLKTQNEAASHRRNLKTIWRPFVELVSEGGFKPLFQENNLEKFMKRLPDIEETEVDVRESNACTQEWLVNEMLLFPSTWLLERQKNKFSRENNEKVLMGFVLSEKAYAPGQQELEKMQKHQGYSAIRNYHYFFDGQPPMLIVEESKRTLRQAMQTDSMKFSTWNSQLIQRKPSTAEAAWKKVLRAVVAGCRYMELVGGVTHGDLCADNIVQTALGEWKITEFGSAKRRSQTVQYLDHVVQFGERLLESDAEREAAKTVANQVDFMRALFEEHAWLMYRLFSGEEMSKMTAVETELSSSEERQRYREKLWLQAEETPNKKKRARQ